jgi:hypothetical protein
MALTAEQKTEIRQARGVESQSALARRYGVTQTHICRVQIGRKSESKDLKAARAKAYREANSESVRLQKAVWYYRNQAQLAERQRAAYAENPEKYKLRRIQSVYGMSALQFQALWAKQEGLCAICIGALQPGKKCHIDHCHKTGAVRGLLCSNCNTGLGHFRDDASRLLSALDYLRKGE